MLAAGAGCMVEAVDVAVACGRVACTTAHLRPLQGLFTRDA